MPKTPYISQIRKALKVKGKSVHNGRGAYECSFNCSMDELFTRAEELIAKLVRENKVDYYKKTKESIVFHIKLEEEDGCGEFKSFEFNRMWPYYVCEMILDEDYFTKKKVSDPLAFYLDIPL